MVAVRQSWRRRWWWFVGLPVALVLAFGVGLATRSGGSSGLRIGGAAPAWSGVALDGTKVTSVGERGRWVVLNFFATWCGPCKAETPQLVRFAADHPSSQVQVVGVIYADAPSSVRPFAQSHDMTWPLIGDANDRISSSYGVLALPQSFVIRPDGVLAAHVYGGVTAQSLDKLVGGAGEEGKH